ncbi:hypothetical protein AAFF_G00355140 [Aldrovandia affinis]|uniref:Reverse transcriptase/retrotransposon-derived protein RNase H-like domain-containing protein n=1 Tax=Aldrovandia affinis TaxID=143900 RepID=A0AAD7SJK9_9TELE|nr:hypothetical protein AAFF_G00355140 [Aldrovandia affinis]
MAATGVIEPSDSPWAAPAVLVKKMDNTWRFCVDYRRLNAVTRKDSYPLPLIDDALDNISATDPTKITAVRDWPPPPTSATCGASWYRRYVQDFATIARPLHRMTDRGQPYIWDDPCTQAFNALQTALITAPVLVYPGANRPFVLDMDASNVGVGAILSQPSDSGEQEARAQLAPTVATLRTVDGEAGCLPLSPAQVQEVQERDVALTHVQDTETRA